IIGAHTDSPGFRIRHNGFFKKNAYSQAGIEIYGGPLLSSWSDKDLGIAGRILIKKANDSPKSGQSRENSFESLLWKSDKALLRIPQLAIHLNREVNDKGLKFNKENELTPILCSMQDVDLNEEELLNYIAQDLGIFRKDIHSYSLELFDMQKAALGGMHDDMIFAGRIDNLAMCIAGLNMLTELDEEPDSTLLLMLFDSEEIGSSTINGGASPLLMRTMERLMFKAGLNTEEQAICLSNSRIFSADGAHAVHPNFTSKHPEKHPVYMNAGPVIKVNANQRYASNLQTIAETEELAKMAGVPVQKYYHRNDIPCGSTIGPISATGTGIPTVDIGNAMLSMHSIRECTGTADQWYME
ncbi:MAG: M18 family aminopeptidase, partial [Candidatus Marinimicrobia bacterium]|nr:M18 family aminopeptidase [Candidatus Neomarinimicrobiota bacterium]